MKSLRLAAAVAAVLASGCGSGDETDDYALISVTGTVTLDGKPLDGAKVIFTPQGNVPDTPGSDVTGKGGNFKIMYRGRSGVARGKYSVLVSKTLDGVAAEPPSDDSGAFSEDAVLAAMKKQGELTAASVKKGAKKSRPLIVTQTFDREVGDKAEVFDFDLKKR